MVITITSFYQSYNAFIQTYEIFFRRNRVSKSELHKLQNVIVSIYMNLKFKYLVLRQTDTISTGIITSLRRILTKNSLNPHATLSLFVGRDVYTD